MRPRPFHLVTAADSCGDERERQDDVPAAVFLAAFQLFGKSDAEAVIPEHPIGVSLTGRGRTDLELLVSGKECCRRRLIGRARRSLGVVGSAAQGGTCEGGWGKHVEGRKTSQRAFSSLIPANIPSALVAFLTGSLPHTVKGRRSEMPLETVLPSEEPLLQVLLLFISLLQAEPPSEEAEPLYEQAEPLYEEVSLHHHDHHYHPT